MSFVRSLSRCESIKPGAAPSGTQAHRPLVPIIVTTRSPGRIMHEDSSSNFFLINKFLAASKVLGDHICLTVHLVACFGHLIELHLASKRTNLPVIRKQAPTKCADFPMLRNLTQPRNAGILHRGVGFEATDHLKAPREFGRRETVRTWVNHIGWKQAVGLGRKSNVC